MKRLFCRYFDSLQINMHFVSAVARKYLPDAEVSQVEKAILDRLTEMSTEANLAIEGAHTLFAADGITSQVEYEAQTIDLEVRVVSEFGRRYLELITKVDELMPLLETSCIIGVITQSQLRRRKHHFKKAVRSVAGVARKYAESMRLSMNQLARGQDRAGEVAPVGGGSARRLCVRRAVAEGSKTDHAEALDAQAAWIRAAATAPPPPTDSPNPLTSERASTLAVRAESPEESR